MDILLTAQSSGAQPASPINWMSGMGSCGHQLDPAGLIQHAAGAPDLATTKPHALAQPCMPDITAK